MQQFLDQNARGAVRCHTVRCGAIRCGVVPCGAVRCGAVRTFNRIASSRRAAASATRNSSRSTPSSSCMHRVHRYASQRVCVCVCVCVLLRADVRALSDNKIDHLCAILVAPFPWLVLGKAPFMHEYKWVDTKVDKWVGA